MGVEQIGQVDFHPSGVGISPWTLVFSSDPHLEQSFQKHQRTVWAASELRNLYLNLAAGVINIGITVLQLQLAKGSMFTRKSAPVVVPYMAIAVLHWLLAAHWRQWQKHRKLCDMLFEVAYCLICTLSMPTWVLHGQVTDAKSFVRTCILGSGVLIGYWCRFLTPTLFYTAKWLVSLQFLFQAWYLTGPTCAAIEATSYGAQAARKLSSLLDAFAGTALGSCPTHSCYHSQYMLQLTTGATLLYAHYRMERANRLAFLQSKGLKAVHYWPFVPAMVGFVLHVVVYVQVLAAVWVFLQCSIAAM
eukprot:GHUV01007563.1.p1 GENE.GHUV01007563.1~~GHUV01007563.1.p1  ORF type:complete len:303 (+),score=30.66 GHUV01007563.1:663-1571(+)